MADSQFLPKDDGLVVGELPGFHTASANGSPVYVVKVIVDSFN